MRIKKIKIENFRNFKDYNEINFPEDEQITVIYGPNGVGKTTLHQFFQWVFYGKVTFNKTASNKMYNLEHEQEAPLNSYFKVSGTIDFDHVSYDGVKESYSVVRNWTYQKILNDSKRTNEEFKILKKTDYNWKEVSGDPNEIIEQFLPSGLSSYFFFDGESMISDLNKKGIESATSLRKALYSIFDLDAYDQGIAHIGSEDQKTSAIGRLYSEKSGTGKSNTIENRDVALAKSDVNRIQKRIETCNETIKKYEDIKGKNNRRINELSEQIGNTPSRAKLEEQRKKYTDMNDVCETAIKSEIKSFGKDVSEQYPYLFLSRIVDEAQLRAGLKIEKETLIPGLQKELIESLLNEKQCICGNNIGHSERKYLNDWLKKFPPLSFKYTYNQFKDSAKRWSVDYKKDILSKHIDNIVSYHETLDSNLSNIKDIDTELKNGTNVDNLIEERKHLEDSNKLCDVNIKNANQDLGLNKRYFEQATKKFDELTKNNESNKLIDKQIKILNGVKNRFQQKINDSTASYSKRLCDSIQDILNQMLTSERVVEMSPEFKLTVRDSFGDEAKSEGQFAVVSFAYIGGIFKLLSEIPELRQKEFPLILDGPFSKLDAIQRQNVIDTIPSYSHQIILFSKDDLSENLDIDKKNIWTIYSNAERNVSYVKNVYDEEVFTKNEF